MITKLFKKYIDRKIIRKQISNRDIDALMKEAFANYKDPFEYMDEEKYAAFVEQNTCPSCGKFSCMNGSCDR